MLDKYVLVLDEVLARLKDKKYRYILQSLRKWNYEPRNLNADNVVLIRDSSTPRSNRSFDIFEREIKRKAGLLRKAEVNRKFMQETSIHHR